MRVLVAPNAFKGTLSGPAAARAIARGVLQAHPGARCVELPIADGGDGLIDALRAKLGGTLVSAPARGPLGERRRASYLWVPPRRLAVIEMARASGLALSARRAPLRASSRGTGDLMRDAVRRGARTLIVGMGGSASNDGGAGMARALGARLLDSRGRELPDGTTPLRRLARVEAAACRSLLAGVKVLALSDVSAPLCGPKGSARVFGPQKGASPAQVRVLEAALERWAAVLARDLGVRTATRPGAGAAGGLGAGLLAFAGASIRPGADWVLDQLGIAAALRRTELAITGEGRLDRTSLMGKAPLVLARRARRAGVACAAIAGQVDARALPALRRAGLRRVVSFAQAGARSSSDAMRRAAFWAAKAGALAGCLLLAPVCGALDVDYQSLDRLYLHRHQADNLEQHLARVETHLASAEGKDASLLWRRCRGLVRRGERRQTKAEKLGDYELARKDCESAVALAPKLADAHFWHGVSMGRWGETKGILKALFLVKPIRKAMERTLELDPGHGGAHHVLGEILWQLPGFAGGDKKKALEAFETAVRLSPSYTANHQPLAEAYLHFGRTEDAIRVLKSVALVKEPADPAEFPDNLADAASKLKELESR